jgi:hypothetical protein
MNKRWDALNGGTNYPNATGSKKDKRLTGSQRQKYTRVIDQVPKKIGILFWVTYSG